MFNAAERRDPKQPTCDKSAKKELAAACSKLTLPSQGHGYALLSVVMWLML